MGISNNGILFDDGYRARSSKKLDVKVAKLLII